MKFIKHSSVLLSIYIALFLISGFTVNADSNMDGGGSGGGSQNGTTSNFYSSGDDGVRITVIDIKTNRRVEGTITIDYFKKDKTNKSIIHFGKVCKLEYMGVAGYPSEKRLVQTSEDYQVNSHNQRVAYHDPGLPIIISSSFGNSDIETLKAYFNNENQLRGIAERVGIAYDEMKNGNYKLIIEPIIYLTFEGKYIAMTAHETAKLDIGLGGTMTTGGQIRAKFVSFTHKNLPLSIFLEKKDLGVKRWTGGKNTRVSNGDILTYLGIGILSFEPQGIEVDIEGGDYIYRPNTDVITAVNVSAGNYGDGATSDNPISVRFTGEMINTTVVTGIVIPPGGERLVWIKWRTPDIKLKATTIITVEIIGGNQAPSSTTLTVKINPIAEKEPPNPTADDKKKSTWSDIILPTFPKTGALISFSTPIKSRSWHTYTCTKSSVWNGDYYVDADGEYIEDIYGNKIKIYETVYNFTTNNFSASLVSTNASIKPDSATSITNTNNNYIKSGYGIEMNINSKISAPSDSTIGMQTAVVYFPEFSFKNYRRIGKLPGASLNSIIELPVNLYSINENRIHFLPIWFPDKEYKVYIETLDAWTPAGMLCDKTTASIMVKGSMWDDWHIGIVPDFDN